MTSPSTLTQMSAATDVMYHSATRAAAVAEEATDSAAARTSVAHEVARRIRWGHLEQAAYARDGGFPQWVPQAFVQWWRTHAGNLTFKGSLLLNAILGVGKIVLGVMAMSPFVVVNGLYSLGMGTARFFCLSIDGEQMSLARQYRRYRQIGVIILVASLMFAAYGVRLFFSVDTTTYSSYMALSLATVIFAEVGVGIHQTITRWHDPSPLVHAAKLAGLASALTGLALVQVALRSFADGSGASASNGYGGLFCGGLAAAIGVGMIVRATSSLKNLPVIAPVVEEVGSLPALVSQTHSVSHDSLETSVDGPFETLQPPAGTLVRIARQPSIVPSFSEQELALLCDLAALSNPRSVLEAAPSSEQEMGCAMENHWPSSKGEVDSVHPIPIAI